MTLFSTARTTPSDVEMPTAVDPSYMYCVGACEFDSVCLKLLGNQTFKRPNISKHRR